ncbi:HEAT repeat domain-containing protein [Taylorella equigenitalis]|uniref:HEAT repeat domain-containing protein n=1 Tax=Taylorella equigenitalis TaxID=29575 RepID=UPI00041499D4|nr:HEAT repeat domain-containing protein [Taylorella equigenitalis]ASY42548.1 hypothetical protein CA943_05470 [Taylorella equigenitalis]WDU45975.1 hypothetical protein KNO33_05530 [Taylorella equigenitalis]
MSVDIEKLSNDEDWSVRGTIARRDDLSPSLVEKLAEDEHWRVRRTISINYGTTQEPKPQDLTM